MTDDPGCVSTGIEGLDRVLHGGLPPGELYAVQGEPGTGKTLLGLHFVREGAGRGEQVLLVSFSQRRESLRRTVESFGWSLEGIAIHELAAAPALARLAREQVVFEPAEIELGETMDELFRLVEQGRYHRVVIDSVSELRLLAGDASRYRHQLLALRDHLAELGATVLVLDNQGLAPGRGELEAVAHGVIRLSQQPTDYGNERRRLRISKLRGRAYQAGVHDLTLSREGMKVFPRRTADGTSVLAEKLELRSGLPELDTLVGGGLATGTSCLIVGPSGTGKTSTATLYAHQAAQRGVRSAVFLFDELRETFVARSEGLGLPIREHLEANRMALVEVGVGELAPGEFVERVLREVDERGSRVVILDTLTGYASAMPDERFLVTQMHELLSSLSRRNVLSILVMAQHGLVGSEVAGPVDVSYLADTVLLLRHFETRGTIRQAISVFKKRSGAHERTIRELRIEDGHIRVGAPIEAFRGVLSGAPTFEGTKADLLGEP